MKDIKFEDALQRLEQIVDQLEGGDLPLEESLKVFEEGVALARRCAKYLEIIAEENLVENARVVGEHLLGKLRELAGEFPGVMSNVRGRGLFIAFDLPDKTMRDKTLAACLENGMMGLASGANAIRFRPHLILTREEADEGVRKLRRAIGSVKA